MRREREERARTSLEGEREREKGLEGRGIMAGNGDVGVWGTWWMCRVESQEAEMRSLC